MNSLVFAFAEDNKLKGVFDMNLSVKKLVTAAVIGAVYAALTMVLAPISYGMVQFRVSEALCILPFFFPASAIGLTVGCVIANILGPGAGLLDIIFGSLATLLAGICTAAIGIRTRKLGKVSWGACIAAVVMPILFNAFIVGAVLTTYLSKGFVLCATWVGLGEAVVMFGLGLPAMRYILKSTALTELFAKLK